MPSTTRTRGEFVDSICREGAGVVGSSRNAPRSCEFCGRSARKIEIEQPVGRELDDVRNAIFEVELVEATVLPAQEQEIGIVGVVPHHRKDAVFDLTVRVGHASFPM